MITIAVLSQKGGVGKTFTCANVAATLADRGVRVLMVDLDPQADLSASWGVYEGDVPRVEHGLAGECSPLEIAVRVPLGRARDDLALLATAGEPLRRLTARLLAGGGDELAHLLGPLRKRFDLALVDTPAGDTVFGRQALVAADLVVVPMLPGFHELRAFTRALDVIDERAQDAGTHVGLLGALVLNADSRWRSTKEYRRHLATMAADHDIAVFDTIIPRHQPVTEHSRYGIPTAWLRPACSVAEAYRALAIEIIDRLGALGALEPKPSPLSR